ncbi:MAG: alginate O-acetyltransferase [Flavobacteriales bacterium]|nr:MAG: alginate O-acetyltransferase [Flavobacteriales bacterium]
MIFNSVTFIIFLFIVVGLYWVLPSKPRQLLLFTSSLIFYGFWRYEYTLIMLASAINDYFISLLIHKTKDPKKRKSLLLFSLFVNLGFLFYFKYLLFFAENAVSVINLFGFNIDQPSFSILLPLGISFYTFQTISYTVDVYRGFIKPQKNFILYGSYVTFFPQLVAGPILRAQEVIYQLKIRARFQIKFINDGIIRILFGLFLKVVITDNIAPIVDQIYSVPVAGLSAIDVWVKAFLFGFQIYFDFSAYSHIAIGAAKLMGISFPENFNYPYLAISFKSFWKRWHISLSSWIRDYLYLPILGVKVMDKSTGGLSTEMPKASNANRALFLTWAIMGLWHGASWAFVFWGAYHASLIFIERKLTIITRKINKNIRSILGWGITLPLAMLSWLPFRENNLSDVFIMFKKLFIINGFFNRSFSENTYLITALLLILTIISFLIHKYLLEKIKKNLLLYSAILVITVSFLTILDLTFLRPISQFIYFQF